MYRPRRMKRPQSKVTGFPLLRMPLAILLIVLEDLYEIDREAIFNFRLVSKACRNESEYLFYRSVRIHDRTVTGQSPSSKMLERLMDRNGATGEYVRHLKIGPFKDEDKFMAEISPMLEDILRSVNNLQALTWSVNCEPPPVMLDLFHELHPSAHLHFILRNRKFQPLSCSLLSSPQLHTLDTEIHTTIPDGTGPPLSETSFIKSILPPSLLVLRLATLEIDGSVQRAQFGEWESVKCNVSNSDIQPGDRSHALVELALRQDTFGLIQKSWARATSWERLQWLDLPEGVSPRFIASLTNRATNLKYLRFYIDLRTHWSPYRNGTWTTYPLGDGLSILASFLASIKSLHSLDFGVKNVDTLTKYVRVMLQSLDGSLKSLTLTDMGGEDHSGPIDYTPGMLAWDTEHYMEVLELAPALEHLDVRIGTVDTFVGNWTGEQCHADAEKKWKTAKKHGRCMRKPKIQRSQKTQRLVL